ncbi:MAG: ornithine carbamoyltransferase [Treponema sp.]|nr:MAG: ornithine carbamoyltransferase [Treponema sp.]
MLNTIRGKSEKSLRGRNFLKLLDFTSEEIRYLLDLSKNFKSMKRNGVPHKYLEGKNVVLLFEKTSTRTRCAFEVAGSDLGLGVTYIGPGSSQMGHKESFEDTARVLGRMYDGIEYRGFAQEYVETLGEYAGVPVWNGLTTEFHPTQMLADLLTIEEHFGRLKGLKFTYMGDARNNMANSLMIACAKMGIHFTACAPKSLFPEDDLVANAKKLAAETGATVTLTEDVKAGTKGADIIYTDIWVSMGEPDSVWEERIKLLKPYQVNKAAFDNASDEAIFLHCLPSFHDTNTVKGKEVQEKFGLPEMEVTNEVFESARSLVFQEAENRMHTIKAVMYATMS